ncbi:MAG: immunoglobulin domain-containing protein [Ignavibacteriaceae bacterium]|nr:immunoglobulin domain-containing protein [Ignavibacteriaceae bacterium]
MKAKYFIIFLIAQFSFSNQIFSQVPVITKHPVSIGTIEGQTATFQIAAIGDSLLFQWVLNDTLLIPGANDSVFTTPALPIDANRTNFKCIVSNSFGSDTSINATLFVTAIGSRVTENLQVLYKFNEHIGNKVNDSSLAGTPYDLTIDNISAVTWTPQGLGINDLAYINNASPATKIIDDGKLTNELTIEVWIKPALETQQDGARIITLSQNKDNSNFSILHNNKYFDFRVRTTNTSNRGEPGLSTASGTATTDLIHLVCTRANDGISKIYKNGVVISSGVIEGDFSNWNTTYRLQIGNEFQDPRMWLGTYYLVSVYNRALSQAEIAGNYDVGVVVDKKPEIIIEPNDLGLLTGQSATFSVNSVGNNPLSYQWYKNGSIISGETSSSYTIPTLTLSDDGNLYSCVVSNSFGNDTSRSARLSVTSQTSRVSSGNTVLYDFLDGAGDTIRDVANFGEPLNLLINTPSSVLWKPYGLIVDSITSIFSTSEATKLYDEALAKKEFTFECWIKPENLTQFSASIFSISANSTDRRNFKLNQEGTSLKSWLRVSTSSVLGYELSTPLNSVTNNMLHIVYIYNKKEKSQLFINGVEKAISFPLGVDLSNWRPDYTLKLANEIISNQPWKGLYNLVSLYNRALSTTEIQHNFALGPIGNFLISDPDSLLAQANFPGQVQLYWRDNSSTEDSFVVERKTPATNFVKIISLPPNSISYIDSTVLDTTIYTYRIKGINLLTESQYSNEYSVTTLLSSISAPSNLSAIPDPSDSTIVQLTWQDNSSNELGFIIERKLGDSSSTNSYIVLDTLTTDLISYQDTSVLDTTMYTYRVKGYNQFTESFYSNQAQILTPIPVEITLFTASVHKGKVLLKWETASELNNRGFVVQRSIDQINYIDLEFIKGVGSTSIKQSYSFTDNAELTGKVYYRLKQLDLNGSINFSRSVKVDLNIPRIFALEQNFPNPFNPSTNIKFSLPIPARVELKIFNTLGQEIATILNENVDLGVHEITFNAGSLPSGIYFYMLRAQGIDGSLNVSTKRMVLIK